MKKKIFYITAILAGATILTACSKDDLQENTLDAAIAKSGLPVPSKSKARYWQPRVAKHCPTRMNISY